MTSDFNFIVTFIGEFRKEKSRRMHYTIQKSMNMHNCHPPNRNKMRWTRIEMQKEFSEEETGRRWITEVHHYHNVLCEAL